MAVTSLVLPAIPCFLLRVASRNHGWHLSLGITGSKSFLKFFCFISDLCPVSVFASLGWSNPHCLAGCFPPKSHLQLPRCRSRWKHGQGGEREWDATPTNTHCQITLGAMDLSKMMTAREMVREAALYDMESMGLTSRNEYEHHGGETLVLSNPPVRCRYPSTHSYCLASQPKCWKRQPGGRLSSLYPAPWQDPFSLSPSWHICPSNLQHWWYHPSPPPSN